MKEKVFLAKDEVFWKELHKIQCAGGVEPPTKFSKKGLDRISIFRGGCWKRGGNFFQGAAVFTSKIN